MRKEITFDSLERVLLRLGFYRFEGEGSHRTYRHPSSGAIVALPAHGRDETARSVHLVAVKRILSEMGVLDRDSLDSLLEKEV